MSILTTITETLFGQGETEAEKAQKARDAEVTAAEGAQRAAVVDGGTGLNHESIARYDIIAHHLAHEIHASKLHDAELAVMEKWDSLYGEDHDGENGSIAALKSLKGAIIEPALRDKTREADTLLRNHAVGIFQQTIMGQAHPGELKSAVKDEFCNTVSMQVCGVEMHPLAVQIFLEMLEPMVDSEANMAQGKAVEVVEEQQEEAEQEIEEEHA
ncbi:MAG: hypothetical protein K8W52_41560 [Deltaproteobacteria bacterium]|nr:hypothetical protein [Deltaproteobacteria bacterium]